MQLLSNLVGDLAWPFSAVVIISIFRDPLRKKLGQLSRVRKGDMEAWFEEGAAQVEAETQAVAETLGPRLAVARDQPVWDRVTSLAASSPRSAVLEAYVQVEQALQQHVEPDTRPRPGAVNLARSLATAGKIDPALVSSITELSLLRNQAAHAAEFPISEKGAISYVQAAQRVTRAVSAISEAPSN
jgi:hypothetical protein